MNPSYSVDTLNACFSCNLRKGFCDLSPKTLKQLGRVVHPQAYPAASSLFMEGQDSRGVFILCSGKVKLTTMARDGKLFILRMAGAGDVLGLSAALSNVPYEATAICVSACRVSFVDCERLFDYLAASSEAALHAAAAVSYDYQHTCEQVQEILMAPSSTGKLVNLLLSWTSPACSGEREQRVRPLLTHEEIAQMIGSSRETVTRILGDLRRRELIRLEGATLIIRDRSGLEDLAY